MFALQAQFRDFLQQPLRGVALHPRLLRPDEQSPALVNDPLDVLVRRRGDRFALVSHPRQGLMGARRAAISGNPDFRHISTSHAERLNLSIRMGNRRFTRLTNAHSKKAENHKHAFALFAMHYNFCRIHQSLRVTPAMQAGITDHVWELSEIVELLDQQTAQAA